MNEDRVEVSWVPALGRAKGPLYLAIADEIAADIAAGRLANGMRLPPQRVLAAALGIDFTTVSRAYNEARRRWSRAAWGRVPMSGPVRGVRAVRQRIASRLVLST